MTSQRLGRASLYLFSALCAFMIWFGIVYATVRGMLYFHAAAVPVAARPDVLPLYFALMRLIGASSLALGLLSLYVVWGPLRRGAEGAASMLLATFAIVFLIAAYTAVRLHDMTGAPTAWYNMAVLLTIGVLAFACHWGAKRRN